MNMNVIDFPWKEPDGSLNLICANLRISDLGEAGKKIAEILQLDDSYEIQLVVTAIENK